MTPEIKATLKGLHAKHGGIIAVERDGDVFAARKPTAEEAAKYVDQSDQPVYKRGFALLQSCRVYPEDKRAGTAALERHSLWPVKLMNELKDLAGRSDKPLAVEDIEDEELRSKLEDLESAHGPLSVYQRKGDTFAVRAPTRMEAQEYTDGFLGGSKDRYATQLRLVQSCRVYPDATAGDAMLARWTWWPEAISNGITGNGGLDDDMVSLEGN